MCKKHTSFCKILQFLPPAHTKFFKNHRTFEYYDKKILHFYKLLNTISKAEKMRMQDFNFEIF